MTGVGVLVRIGWLNGMMSVDVSSSGITYVSIENCDTVFLNL